MKLEFVNNFLNLIMNVFELAVSEFRNFGLLSCLVCNLQNVCDFTAYSGFMSYNFRLEMHLIFDLKSKLRDKGVKMDG